MMAEIIRLQVFFKGRVQGVGFRFYAERIANKYPLTGFVRNLPNGDVEVVADAERGILDEFLKEVQSGHLGRFITEADKLWKQPTGKFEGFSIRF